MHSALGVPEVDCALDMTTIIFERESAVDDQELVNLIRKLSRDEPLHRVWCDHSDARIESMVGVGGR